MFTGIIEEIGRVLEVIHGSSSIKLKISCKKILEDIKAGDSISVDGICLTATGYGKGWFSADVMPETMRRTGLSRYRTNSSVNLERALRLSDRLGGHIVSGHIDGMGTIVQIKKEDNALWFFIKAPDEIMKYIIEKGSVAIDGISLTVALLDERGLGVSLIPHTAGVAALGSKKEGDPVNIECDILGKYVEKLLENKQTVVDKKAITAEFLKENGFM